MTYCHKPAAGRNARLRTVLGLLLLTAVLWPACGVCAEDAGGFTVVLLPDTQFYSEKFPDTYLAQTEWIKQHAEDERIEFVIHLGDIVQNHDAEAEWKAADRAHRVLDGAVPYSVLPGNHDMSKERDSTLYNKYFSPARFKDRPWYGGSMDETNDNNYCLFTAAGMDFMVLSLEYRPRDHVVDWANRVIAEHPGRRVIVATHRYMSPDKRTETGDRLWQKLIRHHADVFLAVSGHHMEVNHQTSTNEAGRPVHELLCDYQGQPNGGNGWLQLLRFDPGRDEIRVETYSPTLKQHKREPAHNYTLDYDMGPAARKKAG